jgi:hypothetical protein
MVNDSTNLLLHHLRKLAAADRSSTSDSELLQRFVG